MKKIIFSVALAITSLTLSSCVSYNQENLNLNFTVAPKYSNSGNNKSVNLIVTDERTNKDLLGKDLFGKDLLGQKRLGANLITIKSNQDLVNLIQNKIARDLEQSGFVVGNLNSNMNKTLEVEILTLNYSAYREFFIGTSKIEVVIKINVKNKDHSLSYSTTQSLALNKNHFIMPLITTDEKTINSALQDALDGILNNQKLVEALRN